MGSTGWSKDPTTLAPLAAWVFRKSEGSLLVSVDRGVDPLSFSIAGISMAGELMAGFPTDAVVPGPMAGNELPEYSPG
jgi:hypothetical protein